MQTNNERRKILADKAAAAGCTVRTMYRRQRSTRTDLAVAESCRNYDARQVAQFAVGTPDISNWPRDFVDVGDRDAIREDIQANCQLTETQKIELLAALPAVPDGRTEGFISRSQMLSKLPSECIGHG